MKQKTESIKKLQSILSKKVLMVNDLENFIETVYQQGIADCIAAVEKIPKYRRAAGEMEIHPLANWVSCVDLKDALKQLQAGGKK